MGDRRWFDPPRFGVTYQPLPPLPPPVRPGPWERLYWYDRYSFEGKHGAHGSGRLRLILYHWRAHRNWLPRR
jgi:hypothetical protein